MNYRYYGWSQIETLLERVPENHRSLVHEALFKILANPDDPAIERFLPDPRVPRRYFASPGAGWWITYETRDGLPPLMVDLPLIRVLSITCIPEFRLPI